MPCAELTRMTDLGCQPHLMSASGRRTRVTEPDNSAAMTTSTTTRENMPAIPWEMRSIRRPELSQAPRARVGGPPYGICGAGDDRRRNEAPAMQLRDSAALVNSPVTWVCQAGSPHPKLALPKAPD